VPPGFSVTRYAGNVPGARSLALGERGTVFAGTREQGRVYALVDADGDARAERVVTIAAGLRLPNGVAVRDGALYVAEMTRVLRFDAIEDRLDAPPPPVVVSEMFPEDRVHGWKFIAFGPDGRLYVPVGAPCDACASGDARFSTIMRMQADGSAPEIFASGIRNTVGFDWHPETGELWFTENGRDALGDEVPADELNHAPVPGLHFGFPYCHGAALPDPVLGFPAACAVLTPPALELGPHVAALGMRFYTASTFPEAYHGQVFVAEHGSRPIERAAPLGYRVTLVRFEAGRPTRYEVFADGWLQDGVSWGRPVDVLVMPDGALLVSDDRAGQVYRIAYDAARLR
jgi:glucose/arabinose dehydrogenase